MSKEKRFIVINPSHHKKPRTMFLNKTNSGKCVWLDSVPYITTLWFLSDAQAFAASSPVAIWFIEDKDWISLLEAEDMPKFKDILKYAEKAECEIIRYKPQDMIPPIVAPSEQALADEALREIAQQLKNQPTTIYCKNNGEPIVTQAYGERDSQGGRPLPEHLENLCVVYCESDEAKDNDNVVFYDTHTQCIRVTINGKFANLFYAEHAREFIDILRQDMPDIVWKFQKAGEMKRRLEAVKGTTITHTQTITLSDIEQKRRAEEANKDNSGTVTIERAEVGDTVVQKITVADENGKSVSGTTKTKNGVMSELKSPIQAAADDKDLKVIPLPKTQEQVGSYQFKKMPSGEVEIREYVVFYSPNKDEYKFYNVFSEVPKITIFGQPATLLTESVAEDTARNLSRNSPKSWFYYKADYFLRKEKQKPDAF